MTRPSGNKAKSSKERDRAQETLSRFSQAASAIEPSEDGGIYGKSYKSKKSRNHDEEDTYRHYQQSKKSQPSFSVKHEQFRNEPKLEQARTRAQFCDNTSCR